MRIRIALVAVVASLVLGAVGVAVAAGGSNGTAKAPSVATVPAMMKVPVSGFASNGRKFTGTYNIQRFKAKGNKVYSVGILKGKLGNRHVTRYNVMAPVDDLNSRSGSARDPRATMSCTVLHLVLGPINLNLLGLNISLGGGTVTPGTPATEPITLNITATPSGSPNGGLLGDLLCGLNNALGGSGGILGQLSTSLQQLASALNAIGGLLGGGNGAGFTL